jgi:hypothetical protein
MAGTQEVRMGPAHRGPRLHHPGIREVVGGQVLSLHRPGRVAKRLAELGRVGCAAEWEWRHSPLQQPFLLREAIASTSERSAYDQTRGR